MYRILVVEDNPVNSKMVSQWLTRKGYEVGTVENGELAVQCTYHHSPDLVLMDMSLPVMDGWTATQTLRKYERTSKVPIIALTAHAMQSDQERAIECGCDAFVAKPIDFKKLKSTMDELLEGKTASLPA